MSIDIDNVKKSDMMVCNTRANASFKFKKENDIAFLQQVRNTQPTKLKPIGLESLLQRSKNPREYVCNDSINSRGGNAVSCQDNDICTGYDCYDNYHMQEYLMRPCKFNTFRNFLIEDDNKICSRQHQLFNNLTKRVGNESDISHDFSLFCD